MKSSTRSPALQWTFIVVLLLMVILASIGIVSRNHHLHVLRETAHTTATQQVIVFNPLPEATTATLDLPADVQAFKDAAIYARSSGYLKYWYADIGTVVKQGDLIALIETPELDAQVLQAKSDLATAQANYDLAETTALRWQELVKTRTVSVQDLDNKVGDAAAKKALLDSAHAHLQQLAALQTFEQIRAPFSGTISVRNIDIGDLVNSSSSGHELFHLVDKQQLRIYVQIPQAQASAIKVGMHADLSVAEHPGHHYSAKVIKNAGALDPLSRTVLVELLFDNADQVLNPGDFASISFRLATPAASLQIPVTALIFRGDGLQVACVDAAHQVHLTTVVPGRDFGKRMEILSGISANSNIIDNPPDSILDGEAVKIASIRKLNTEAP